MSYSNISGQIYNLENKEHVLTLEEAFDDFKSYYEKLHGGIRCTECWKKDYIPKKLIAKDLAIEFDLDISPLLNILTIECCNKLVFWKLSRYQQKWTLGKVLKENEIIEEDDKSLLDIINEITKSIPDEEWDKLPKNASQMVGNFERYIAICPKCGEGLFTEEIYSKNNSYHCLGCNEHYKLVKIKGE